MDFAFQALPREVFHGNRRMQLPFYRHGPAAAVILTRAVKVIEVSHYRLAWPQIQVRLLRLMTLLYERETRHNLRRWQRTYCTWRGTPFAPWRCSACFAASACGSSTK